MKSAVVMKALVVLIAHATAHLTPSQHAACKILRIQDSELEHLLQILEGSIVVRHDPNYANVTQLNWNLPFWLTRQPVMVVFSRNTADVSRTVAWAQRNRVKLTPAAGRHSSEGYCFNDEVVLDFRQLRLDSGRTMELDARDNLLTVSASVSLGEVTTFCREMGYVTALGTCPSVGLAGYTLGGGFSPYVKMTGLGVDSTVAFTVVLSSGIVVRASKDVNADLFFALRGAGHQSFGYVVSITKKLIPMRTMLALHYILPLGPEPEFTTRALKLVLELYTRNSTWLDSKLSIEALSFARYKRPDGPWVVEIPLYFLDSGTEDIPEMMRLVEPLTRFVSGRTLNEDVSPILARLGYEGDYLYVPESPSTYISRLGLYLRPSLKLCDVERMVRTVLSYQEFEASHKGVIGAIFVFELYEGTQVFKVSASEMAFAHRHVSGDFAVDLYSLDSISYDATVRWLRGLYEGRDAKLEGILATYPTSQGQLATAYQNYIFAGYGQGPLHRRWGALQRYYGPNLCQLVAIKKKYDPREIFDFPQGIPASAPAGEC